MRILIATSHRNVVGGVEKYLQTAIPGLLRRGHSISLLHEYSFDKQRESIDPLEARLASWSCRDLGAKPALDAVDEWEPDLVYSHGLNDGLLEDALVNRYPVIWYAHTYLGTCISGRKCHSWPDSRPCSRRLGAACLLLYYPRRCGGTHPGTMWRLFREQKARLARFQRYQCILVASRHMLGEIEQHGVPTDRVRLVPLPMTSNLPDTAPPAAKSSPSRILFLGRLIDVKGAGHLIRALPYAAKRLGRSLLLTIAGDGEERGKLQNLAAQLNVAVNFAGWLDSEQKINLLRQSDLLAVPSLWPEPFGLVGVEAGHFGLPAVGYAVGGIPDWLVSGKTGELAPANPPEPQGLAEAIFRALSDPGHYSKLCMGAWEMSRQFTVERHFAQLELILADSTATQTGGSRRAHLVS